MEEKIIFAMGGAIISGCGILITVQVQIAILKEKVAYLSKQCGDIAAVVFPKNGNL